MRVAVVLAIFVWSVACSGCALIEDSGRNLALSVARPVEESLECMRNRRWAQDAWNEVAATESYSDHYGKGFREGFAEYLFSGNALPPIMPAPCYRSIAYQTRDGHRAIQDWFAGYRHGVNLAQERNLRQWITGPSALSPVTVSCEPATEDVRYILGMPHLETKTNRPVVALGQAQ